MIGVSKKAYNTVGTQFSWTIYMHMTSGETYGDGSQFSNKHIQLVVSFDGIQSTIQSISCDDPHSQYKALFIIDMNDTIYY